MKFSTADSLFRRTPAAGFTLVEVMASAIAATLLLAAVVSLGIFSTQSFYMMGNYSDLDAQSRIAVDTIGREVRNSSLLLGYSTSNPQFLLLTNTTPGNVNGTAYNTCSDKITYDSTTSNLVLTITYYSSATPPPTLTRTLLMDCNLFEFSLYNRAPNITTTNITFNSETVASNVKVINLSWKCSRKIKGLNFNTESVQTAQINLRNKVE